MQHVIERRLENNMTLVSLIKLAQNDSLNFFVKDLILPQSKKIKEAKKTGKIIVSLIFFVGNLNIVFFFQKSHIKTFFFKVNQFSGL